jgi:hypothetical protein
MLGSQDSQHIPLEQLKAQRDKAWEECCRLDWLICKEQNRQAEEWRKQKEEALQRVKDANGGEVPIWFQPQDWQYKPSRTVSVHPCVDNLPKTWSG